MELDRIPLWRGQHVSVRQLTEDFAKYIYLPRLRDPQVLSNAVQSGLGLLLWQKESFAYADSFDEATGRYRGLRCGQSVDIFNDATDGLVVHPDTAAKQQEIDAAVKPPTNSSAQGGSSNDGAATAPVPASKPSRYYGTVTLDSTRVGRDAGRIAEEVIAHLAGLVGSTVNVTLEIEATVPDGTPDNVVRTVTENSRTLKFVTHGFERE